MKRFVFALVALLLFANASVAQNREAIDRSTDVLMFVPAAAGATIALIEGDYKGLLQLTEACATSVAASYLLKYTVKKERPDGSDMHSFPSNHTGFSFAGAAYIQRRYGWAYGAAAYAVSAYVGWGRIYAKRHDIWDVLAGCAIGVGSAYLYTRPFARDKQLQIAPVAVDGGCGVYMSLTF